MYIFEPSHLDNITWQTLAGEHRRYSQGDAQVRRYALGYAPIAGFAEPNDASGDLLSRVFEHGEVAFVCGVNTEQRRWPGWQKEFEGDLMQLVWASRGVPRTGTALDAVALDASHAAQMVELAQLTAPGPVGERTHELGTYYGVFDNDQLVAKAGQRMRTARMCEISAVCTRPSHRRRGLARGLVRRLVRESLLGGRIPFLHVAAHNHGAAALYMSLGFEHRRSVNIAVLRRTS